MAEAQTKAKEDKVEDEVAKFSVEDLCANARSIAGVSRHVMAGALHGVSGKLTREEAAAKAEAFCKKEIKG